METIRRRRKYSRLIKKISRTKEWEQLSIQNLKQVTRERISKVQELRLSEINKLIKAKERAAAQRLEKKRAHEKHLKDIQETEDHYFDYCAEQRDKYTTAPLLHDAIVIPIVESMPYCSTSGCFEHAVKCKEQVNLARKERNNALHLAKYYRNLADEMCKEQRALRIEQLQTQHQLESKVECIRDFWRNKVVEADSRSGKMLRAALLRNN